MSYLTKSKFKLALECPAKLHYFEKGYPSSKIDNSFLESLANGGFQVGELAKCYNPFGYEVKETNPVNAVVKTRELLKRKRVTIYEAAFMYNNLFVRVDVLKKNGSHIELMEVKSKTFDPTDPKNFTTKEELSADWREYVYDVAFQKYVVSLCLPDMAVSAYLYLIDKSVSATVNGLNQLFIVVRNEDKSTRIISRKRKLTQKELGDKILCKVNVDYFVEKIMAGTDKYLPAKLSTVVEGINEYFKTGRRPAVQLSAKCGGCEYRIKDPVKNGFRECWKAEAGFTDSCFQKPSTLDLWALYMGNRKDLLIKEGKYFLHDIQRADIEPKSSKTVERGLSHIDRRMLQIDKEIHGDPKPYLDRAGLREEMEQWQYPLHFIDFETTATALPFYAGTNPYEQIAFQFSHHTLQADGTVTHQSEWICRQAGAFPNFDFVRELRAAVGDTGTIFRYATHENTILNAIYLQLQASDEPDRLELGEWIKTITVPVSKSVEYWEGERNMVDLCELVKKYYYHPATKGSNSIKAVMGAVLSTSRFLQSKYSQPVYGTTIPSRNFTSQSWIVEENGKVKNPYSLLPPLFEELDENITYFSDSNELKDGGAAMTAYAKLQYVQMHETEREAILSALLKYCELDTLSMVMLLEEWLRELKKGA